MDCVRRLLVSHFEIASVGQSEAILRLLSLYLPCKSTGDNFAQDGSMHHSRSRLQHSRLGNHPQGAPVASWTIPRDGERIVGDAKAAWFERRVLAANLHGAFLKHCR